MSNNKWTALYVKLNGDMKRIGNVNPSTGAVSFYPEGFKYNDCTSKALSYSPDLYYVNDKGLYQQYN